MTVQTFNPTDLSQSATNWAVAQRIVGAFAPHAQLVPNLTVAVDPGHLLNGTNLTEVNAQSAGPFTPPSSGFRIDRVVIDRATGAASVVTGGANSLTPPAIPAGKLPVARVMLLPATAAITNDLIVDERALVDLTAPIANQVICRATRGGVSQNIPNMTYTKVLFNGTDFNVGSGFDTTNSRFLPAKAGYYSITLQVFMNMTANHFLQAALYKNGVGMTSNSSATPVQFDFNAAVTDTVYLNGIDDYIEGYVYHNNGAATNLYGQASGTFLTATIVG